MTRKHLLVDSLSVAYDPAKQGLEVSASDGCVLLHLADAAMVFEVTEAERLGNEILRCAKAARAQKVLK